MKIHQIKARDLPDLWFQAVHDILDEGNRFVIDRGSYAGQTRLEYDYFCGHVLYPYTMPLIPDIPPALGIPNPVEEAYIYGFAIVENYKAIFGMCIYQNSPQYSGFNHYLHGRKLFDP